MKQFTYKVSDTQQFVDDILINFWKGNLVADTLCNCDASIYPSKVSFNKRECEFNCTRIIL